MNSGASAILESRIGQIHEKGTSPFKLECDKNSAAGSVSQRACVFCGSRVVLYPIADALHLIHGPIGCAAYTWDIRGSLSSGPELHRKSFSTDLRELDVVYGGEKKLERSLDQLIDQYSPKAAFVYATCIIGAIGDDVDAVCGKMTAIKGIPVIPVHSEGFKGTKKDGYKAACTALGKLVGTGDISGIPPAGINILGEFNLAGEAWIIRDYYERMGVKVVSILTGDGRVEDVSKAHGAALNVVQCSGSLTPLAQEMEKKYGIPFLRVSYFGIEDCAAALYDVADWFVGNAGRIGLDSGHAEMIRQRARNLVADETARTWPKIRQYADRLKGKKAGLYVGGAFKTFSLLKILRSLGVSVELAGSQTGNEDDYKRLEKMGDDGMVIVDDSNPLELSHFIKEKDIDLFIGGVKERPIAYKIGVGFCDHNHERKIALAGFEGVVNFAREISASALSPVWRFMPRRSTGGNK